MAVLEVKDLTIAFKSDKHQEKIVVSNLNFSVERGEILALVGDSGSGKTVTSLAILGLLPPTARILSGSVSLEGKEILNLPEREKRKFRGSKIGYIFQDATSALNPVVDVGRQIAEMSHRHAGLGRKASRRKAIELLGQVGIPNADERATYIPDRLSGGMNQRVMIAMMSLAATPNVLIADEPTSALDVTVQAEILELLRRIVKELNVGLVLITHNLGIVAEYADRAVVLHDGKVVEAASVETLFTDPQSPHTRKLLAAIPKRGMYKTHARATGSDQALLAVEDVHVHFPIEKPHLLVFSKEVGAVRAVDGISFSIQEGETYGLAGESGCGKTTLARAIVQLAPLTAGCIRYQGKDLSHIAPQERAKIVQIVFQDPFRSLEQRMTVDDIIAEGPDVHRPWSTRQERAERVAKLMELVGLDLELQRRFPIELSGGQRQRIAIARALALEPRLLVLDEPVSSLDMVAQKHILDLLAELRAKLGLTYLFISHDLSVVGSIADRIGVMYLGKLVEEGPLDAVYDDPKHPYTQALLSAVPIPDPIRAQERRRTQLLGESPNAAEIPPGCRFHPRCPIAEQGLCEVIEPALEEKKFGHLAACHLVQKHQ